MDTFIFYRSFKDQIDLLENKDRLRLFEAITGYALNGEVPDFEEPILKMAWLGIEPILSKGREEKMERPSLVLRDEPYLEPQIKSHISITKKKEYPFKDLPIEERKERFVKEVRAYESEYGIDLIRAFCDYWTEQKKDKILMRFELEKVFEIGCRLRRWATSNYKTNV